MISVDVQTQGVVDFLDQFSKQGKLAIVVALNRTADDVQKAVQDSLQDHFTLRRADFIKRTIYRKPGEDFATADHFAARVQVNPDRDVLAKFELGGDKVGATGGRVAVPIDIRRNKSDIIPRLLRPRALLASGKAFINKQGAILERVGRGNGNSQYLLAYVLKPSVRITPSLGFEATALKTIDERFPINLEGAFERFVP